jgi:hypothetical protein
MRPPGRSALTTGYYAISTGSLGDIAHGLGLAHHVDHAADIVRNTDGQSQRVGRRFVDDRLQQLRTFSLPQRLDDGAKELGC